MICSYRQGFELFLNSGTQKGCPFVCLVLTHTAPLEARNQFYSKRENIFGIICKNRELCLSLLQKVSRERTMYMGSAKSPPA